MERLSGWIIAALATATMMFFSGCGLETAMGSGSDEPKTTDHGIIIGETVVPFSEFDTTVVSMTPTNIICRAVADSLISTVWTIKELPVTGESIDTLFLRASFAFKFKEGTYLLRFTGMDADIINLSATILLTVKKEEVVDPPKSLNVDSLYVANGVGYMPITCATTAFKGGAVSGVIMMGPRRLNSSDPWNESPAGFVDNGDGTATATIPLPFASGIDTIAFALIVDPANDEWWSESASSAYHEGKMMMVINYTNGIVKALSNGEILYSSGDTTNVIVMEQIEIDSMLAYCQTPTNLYVWVTVTNAVTLECIGGIDTAGAPFDEVQDVPVVDGCAMLTFTPPTGFVGQEIYLKMDFLGVEKATMLDPTGAFVWIKLIWIQTRGRGRYVLA